MKLEAFLPPWKAPQIKMPIDGAFIVTELCFIRRYHVDNELCSSNIGEAFVFYNEEQNAHD